MAWAMMFNNGANSPPSFFTKIVYSLSEFTSGLSTLSYSPPAPAMIVVIMPATEIANAEIPTKFSLAQFLKRSSLVRSLIDSLSSAVSSIISVASKCSAHSHFSSTLIKSDFKFGASDMFL